MTIQQDPVVEEFQAAYDQEEETEPQVEEEVEEVEETPEEPEPVAQSESSDDEELQWARRVLNRFKERPDLADALVKIERGEGVVVGSAHAGSDRTYRRGTADA